MDGHRRHSRREETAEARTLRTLCVLVRLHREASQTADVRRVKLIQAQIEAELLFAAAWVEERALADPWLAYQLDSAQASKRDELAGDRRRA